MGNLTKVSEQVADDQIDVFKEYYEVDTDAMDDDNQKVVESALKNVRKAIVNGRIEITLSDEGRLEIIQRMKDEPGKELHYKVLSGKSKAQMKEKDSSYKKIYTLMGSLSGVGAAGIMQLEGADSSTVESLGTVFLQL